MRHNFKDLPVKFNLCHQVIQTCNKEKEEQYLKETQNLMKSDFNLLTTVWRIYCSKSTPGFTASQAHVHHE